MFLYSKSRLKYVWIGISIWVSVLILLNAGVYFQKGPTPNFLLEKGELRHHPLWATAFYFHVIGACVCLATGPFLMITKLIRYRRLHAVLGYAYLNAVLWVAGPTGLIISPVSKAGFWAALGFFVTGIFWWLSTWLGYRAIRANKLAEHIRWMVRSYSVALSAVWFRLIHYFLSYIVEADTAYIWSVWLSFFLSLWISEVCISRHMLKRKSTSSGLDTARSIRNLNLEMDSNWNSAQKTGLATASVSKTYFESKSLRNPSV